MWWEGKRDSFVVTAMHRVEDCFAVTHKTESELFFHDTRTDTKQDDGDMFGDEME